MRIRMRVEEETIIAFLSMKEEDSYHYSYPQYMVEDKGQTPPHPSFSEKL